MCLWLIQLQWREKAGTGKTTLTGLLIDHLCKEGKGPILAVDADANSNLNEVLGVKVETTLGDIREDVASADIALSSPIPAGMSKQDYLNYKLSSALVEEDDYDLLVMGRTQGKGCYCFVNGLLQSQLTRVASQYKYLVVDNEAGMEHISRGIISKVDALLLVSDCSRRGVQAAGRIAELVRELKMDPKVMKLIINRAPNGIVNEGTMEEVKKQGLELLGVVPQNELVYEYDCVGKPTISLPKDNGARTALRVS